MAAFFASMTTSIDESPSRMKPSSFGSRSRTYSSISFCRPSPSIQLMKSSIIELKPMASMALLVYSKTGVSLILSPRLQKCLNATMPPVFHSQMVPEPLSAVWPRVPQNQSDVRTTPFRRSSHRTASR